MPSPTTLKTLAAEEALVNAMYHRSYEFGQPVEVRVNPDGMVILSYPGPDPSVRIETLKQERILARRCRNRRIGEFLKELKLTEGRCTGIPKIRKAMRDNGSPDPISSTDEQRTHFLVELPIHPQMKKAHDVLTATEQKVIRSLTAQPLSRQEIADVLGLNSRSGGLYKAIDRLRLIGLLDLTIPDKPRSKQQRMKLTAKGQRVAHGL